MAAGIRLERLTLRRQFPARRPRVTEPMSGMVPSRCVIARNTIVGALEPTTSFYVLGQPLSGLGVQCSGGSCARIEGNDMTGCVTHIACQSAACQRSGQALALSGGSPYVAHNVLKPGSGDGMRTYAACPLPTTNP